MAERRRLAFYWVLLIIGAMSSFTLVNGEPDSEKNNDLISQVISPADDSSSQEDSKEKRSREEIMFGNQQNKPNGLVDDMMGMAENQDDDSLISSVVVPEKKANATQDKETLEKALKDGDDSKSDDKRTPKHEEEDEEQGNNAMMSNSDGSNVNGGWYNNPQVSPNALQYLVNSPQLQRMTSEDYANLYDQEDLYRRKRQLLGHPMPLHKRSLRSPLGQMIQSRGRRLPRRSMRLKRNVDVEDLLTLLGNLDNDRGRYYEDQMPERFNTLGYQEAPAAEYAYPYSFIRRVEIPDKEVLDSNVDDGAGDIDSLMLMPPNSRYVEGPEIPYRSREDENEAIQKWLSRHTTPSVFSVSRRSAPVFYPVDYRYVPGYKKRSRYMNPNSNRMSNRLSDEDEDSEFGKWGQVVQVPESYASAEDVARLYALANLMSEEEEPPEQLKMRRSA